MNTIKQIAVILENTLQQEGLRSILDTYFSPLKISFYNSLQELYETEHDSFDYYFTTSDLFAFNIDFFLPRKSKTIILLNNCQQKRISSTNYINYISTDNSIEEIIDQLQNLLANDNCSSQGEGNKNLSVREIDVLQLIVKGIINKEIADKLSISLNTVLTHRKNITAKLGIKTVSGLTFYAIMNGYISADDIEL